MYLKVVASSAVGTHLYCECQKKEHSSLHLPGVLSQPFLFELPQICELGRLFELLQELCSVEPAAKLNFLLRTLPWHNIRWARHGKAQQLLLE